MPHVVLAGDSIFDNAAYTGGAPDVITHLRDVLPPGWQATLRAVDGATTSGLGPQLARLPTDATHLVISVGGNDALQHMDLLSMAAMSSVRLLDTLAARVERFERSYRAAIADATRSGIPTILCTIYNGNLEANVATAARVALTVFNDAIIRTALDAGTDLIELRAVCTGQSDYANPIEPSGSGGRKIANAIARAIGVTSAGDARTIRVFS
jgi:hypothetical protein